MEQLPPEVLSFRLLAPAAIDIQPRLGELFHPNRIPIETPHYIALSSRGAVPHLSQDMMRSSTSIKGIYAALEDYVEKAPHEIPPVYKFPAPSHDSPLRRFIALQNDALLVLGPRRIPPVPCPASNTYTAVSIMTSVGFSMLESEDYVTAVQILRPDIAIGLADVVYGPKAGAKRQDRMGDRTMVWTNELIDGVNDEKTGSARTALFAPILPIGREQQLYYLEHLKDEWSENVSGLVLYEAASVATIPEGMEHLPRLSLSEPKSPHKLLDEIALGIDMFTIPFISAATDAGIALDFSFPPPLQPQQRSELLPLGVDMWLPSHATDVSPLRPGCACYACANHHRAYLQHLLSAKEMLGWVLLALHNHHVVDEFFSGVRASLHETSFSQTKASFHIVYEPDLPAKTGQGPRVRGYQFKSAGPSEKKKNPVAYRSLNDRREKLADAPQRLGPGLEAKDLEEGGFAELFQE